MLISRSWTRTSVAAVLGLSVLLAACAGHAANPAESPETAEPGSGTKPAAAPADRPQDERARLLQRVAELERRLADVTEQSRRLQSAARVSGVDVPTASVAAKARTAPALETRIENVALEKVPLEEALAWVAEQAGLKLRVDWGALKNTSLGRTTPVTLRARADRFATHDLPLMHRNRPPRKPAVGIRAERVLQHILADVSDSKVAFDYRVDGDTLVIDAADIDCVVTRVYDVRALLGTSPNRRSLKLADLIDRLVPPLWASGEWPVRPWRGMLIVRCAPAKHRRVEGLLAALYELLPAGAGGEGIRSGSPQEMLALEADEHVAGETAFALDLYRRLAAETDGNVVFSPLSVRMTLAMAYAGADGATKTQMAKALRFDEGPHATAAAYKRLLERLPGTTQAADGEAAFQLDIANGFWAARGFPFKPRYVGLLKGGFNADVANLDFTHAPAAAERINDWAKRNTHGHIPEIVSPESIKDLTAAALTNAAYFKAQWVQTFDRDETTERTFWVNGTTATPVAMMAQVGEFAYAREEDFAMLELPYAGADCSMIIVLPHERTGLSACEKALSPKMLTAALERIGKQSVSIRLPRFTMRHGWRMAETFERMGITDAFTREEADFSGACDRRIWIDDILHEATIIVDEEGTEAAAATGTVMAFGPKGIPFHADHPFLFLIRDNATGSILFAGRVTAPETPHDAHAAPEAPAPREEPSGDEPTPIDKPAALGKRLDALEQQLAAANKRLTATQRLLDTTPSPTTRPASADDVTRQRLQRRIELIDFDASDFRDVIWFLRESSDVNIWVNWKALDLQGVQPDTPITVKLENVTVAKALEVVLADTGGEQPLAYIVEDGVVTIATKRHLATKRTTRVYDVRNPLGQPVSGREVKLLSDLIKRQIDPSSWGTEEASIDTFSGMLIVTQSYGNHRAIEELLAGRVTAPEAPRDRRPAAPEAPAPPDEPAALGKRLDALEQQLAAANKRLTATQRLLDTTPSPTTRPASADDVTRQRLQRRIELIDFDASDFRDVIWFLRESSDVNIWVNWRTLDFSGVTPKTPITANLADVTVAKALEVVLADTGGEPPLAYIVEDGVVIVSMREDLAPKASTRIYDVRDLLDKPESEREVTSLINLIKHQIDPPSWLTGAAHIDDFRGVLIVKQDNHRALAELLAVIRRALSQPPPGREATPQDTPSP
ncbi:MAG: hypothetical protein KGY99_10840 [Phycisphaerae bacterium]|nr:hypothetical protein [Phycisphaerae bacterium]